MDGLTLNVPFNSVFSLTVLMGTWVEDVENKLPGNCGAIENGHPETHNFWIITL